MTCLLHDRKMVYLRPAKTGSCTVRRTILAMNENNESLAHPGKAFEDQPHQTWKEIRDYLGQETWDEWTKIASVRNPWDQVVSRYYWNLETITDMKQSFSDYVLSNDWVPWSATEILYDGEDLQVDDVIKMETIHEDIKRILNVDFGFYENKGKLRPDSEWKKMYDDKTYNHVYDICYKEIEDFGYEY